MQRQLGRRGLSAERWKTRGFGWEDKLFKLCDAKNSQPVRRFTRQCWNATLGRRTCMCSSMHIDSEPVTVYGPDSAPRQAWRFSCIDLVKYKANWVRNRTLVMQP